MQEFRSQEVVRLQVKVFLFQRSRFVILLVSASLVFFCFLTLSVAALEMSSFFSHGAKKIRSLSVLGL